MVLDDRLRERVILVGGKVAGVECPSCDFDGRDVPLEPHSITQVDCPDCGETILTEDEKSQLRQANKI